MALAFGGYSFSRFGRRMLPVFDIQLVGELKFIEIERLARFDGVSWGEELEPWGEAVISSPFASAVLRMFLIAIGDWNGEASVALARGAAAGGDGATAGSGAVRAEACVR